MIVLAGTMMVIVLALQITSIIIWTKRKDWNNVASQIPLAVFWLYITIKFFIKVST